MKKGASTLPTTHGNTTRALSTSRNITPSNTLKTDLSGQVRQQRHLPPTDQGRKSSEYDGTLTSSANSNQLKGSSSQRSPALPSMKFGSPQQSSSTKRASGEQKVSTRDPAQELRELHAQENPSYEDLNKVLSGSQLKSADVFGLSHLAKDENGNLLKMNYAQKVNYLKDPAQWHPGRIPVQKELYDKQLGAANQLSEAMAKHGEPNTLIAVMGNTAAGKSTSLKTLNDFKHLTPEQFQGAINADPIKYDLEQMSKGPDGQNTIGNDEIHAEGTSISLRVESKMLDTPGASLLYDKRFANPNDFKSLLETSNTYKKSVKAVDIDSELTRSCVRVLQRAPGGAEPRVPFDSVAMGFRGTRENRDAVINGRGNQLGADGKIIPNSGFKGVKDNDKIKSYDLFVPDANGNIERVAYKRDGVWHGPQTAQHKEMYNRAVNTDPADLYAEIDKVGASKIDDAFIQNQVSQMPEKYRASTRDALTPYLGSTLKEALDSHLRKLA